jgi:2-keto-3-deoxy-L-rhamnonate aldolase RhmA
MSEFGMDTLLETMAGRPIVGTFLKLPRVEVVEVLGLAGFDFVICDMEHGQLTESDARGVVRACTASGVHAIVRVPEPSAGVVNRLLEAGAAGISMPRLRTATEARELRAMMRFPPRGVRSIGKDNALAAYGTIPLADYIRRADERSTVIAQFENRDTDDLDAAMRSLDIAFIGMIDLTVDFGAPGDIRDPGVRARVLEIEQAARRAGVALGAVAGSVTDARRLISEGYRFVAFGSDIGFLVSSVMPLIAEIRAPDTRTES